MKLAKSIARLTKIESLSMDFKIHAKYRPWINVLLWSLSILSIAVGFFIFPIYISVPFAVICVVMPLIIGRIIFRYPVLWVHPTITPTFFNRIGTCWFLEKLNGKLIPGLGIVFETRNEAKEVYKIIRSWNYGAYIDSEGNINITIVKESDTKYSIFVYPGDRPRRQLEIEDELKKTLKPNSEVEIAWAKIWIQNCADYADKPKLLSLVKSLNDCKTLLLNTVFVKNNEMVGYAKTSFQLKKFRFINRDELNEKLIEYHVKWEDPNKKYSELIERASQIKLDKFPPLPTHNS